jgi:CheY-like chemotaxis protein
VDKGLDFDFRCDGEMPAMVRVDAQRLRQILINILGNALKFTQRGRVSFHLRYERQMAQFTIRDSGPGISPTDQSRIFEPFQQGSAEQRGPITGTGVGLTIARMLTDLMGGRLQLESQPGEGSCFSLQLFLPELPASPSAVVPAPLRVQGYRGLRRRILIVDDQPNDRELLEGLLRPLGFLLATAGSAAAALALMEGFRPDLVLMDLEMPGMGGWEAIAALRSGPWAATPVAVLSAHGADSEALPAGSVAMADHLVKPLRLDDFLRWLGKRLELSWIEASRDEQASVDGPAATSPVMPLPAATPVPPHAACTQLRAFVREGYLRGIERELDLLVERDPAWGAWVEHLRPMVASFQFERLERALDAAVLP